MTFTKKWTEPVCECGGILDFEDGFYICVNPDCEVISMPSTLVREIQEYNEAEQKLLAYWKIHHKEYTDYKELW